MPRVIVHVDHVIVRYMRPVSVTEVECHMRWFVNERAVAGRDYDHRCPAEVWSATYAEDVQLCQAA
jgi:hypothetical protein